MAKVLKRNAIVAGVAREAGYELTADEADNVTNELLFQEEEFGAPAAVALPAEDDGNDNDEAPAPKVSKKPAAKKKSAKKK